MTRLILLLILLAISLLSIFGAPQYHLWLLAIIVTEYPLIFVGITIILTAWGYRVMPYRVAGTWVGIIAIILYLSPIVRAFIVGNGLKKEMSAAFTGGGSPPRFPAREPFSLGGLFKTTAKVAYQTFTYAEYPDQKLTLDYYAISPKSSPEERILKMTDSLSLGEGRGGVTKPCVVVVHGGSWSSGDSQQLPELNSYLASIGYNVASINYRLAPKHKTPAPVEDVEQAISYLTKHAQELHIDTNKLVLLGRSAGGQIALLAAYTLNDPRIKGVIDFYGPADMVWGYSLPSNPLITDSRRLMRNYIGGPYDEMPDKYKACSPLEFVSDKSIPTLMLHGDNDIWVSPEHSRRLKQKLTQHNIRNYYLDLPWATHGFDYNLNGPGGQLSTYAVETFLNTVMQAP